MKIAALVYICVGATNAVYVIATLIWTWARFIPRLDEARERMTPRKVWRLFQDKTTEVSKRSIILACLSSLGNLILVTDVYFVIATQIDESFDYPCEKTSTLSLLGWCLAIFGFALRAYRYRCQLELSRLRSMGIFSQQKLLVAQPTWGSSATASRGSSVSSAADSGALPAEVDLQNVEKIARLEKWSNELMLARGLLVVTSLIAGTQLVIGLALGWFQDSNRSEACADITPTDYIKYGVLGVYTFIVSPVLVARFYRSKDAFFLRESVLYTSLPTIPCFILYFAVATLVTNDEAVHMFNPANLAMLIIIAMHTFNIVLPLVYKGRSGNRRGLVTDAGFSGMVAVLVDEVQYENFKELASEDFSVENVLFWESILALKRRQYALLLRLMEHNPDLVIANGTPPCLVYLNAYKDELKHSESATLAKEVAARSSAFVSEKAIVVEQKELRDYFQVPMSINVASSIVRIYNSFLTRDSPLELNLNMTDRGVMERLVGELSSRIQALDVNISKRSSLDGFVPNVFLEFGALYGSGRLENETLYVSAYLFSEIKSRALWMLYENIYPRFIDDKRAAKADTKV